MPVRLGDRTSKAKLSRGTKIPSEILGLDRTGYRTIRINY